MKLTRDDMLAIHKALHTSGSFVQLQNHNYCISVHRNGCRTLRTGCIQWMEQNLFKNSKFARQARDGALITWGIPSTSQISNWIIIDSPVSTLSYIPFTTLFYLQTSIKQGGAEINHILV